VVIPCGPYSPHGALVEFFTLSWAVERWNPSSVSLLLSLFSKSIRENMIAMILWFLNIRHSFWYVVPHLRSTIVPSHPTLHRLNMWSSWVRRKGTTQVMYIVKLKNGLKSVKKTFSMILRWVFEMV
jgi:hypothetical protein